MEVVGWSPSAEFQDFSMFELPPQVGGWSGVEDRDSRYAPADSSIQAPLTCIYFSLSLCAGPSSVSFPEPASSRSEPANVNQRRLKDAERVRRPRNSFIIFRCDFTEKYLASGGSERASDTGGGSLSMRAGEAWRNAEPETKRYYKELAEEERAQHRIAHPDYRFRPKRKKPAGRRRSPKKRARSPHPKRSAGRSSSVSSVDQLSQNDPLRIQTITVPTSSSSSTLSQSHQSRQPTPDFFHGYGSTSPTSPCSPLSPVDDSLYMPRPTIAASRSDSLLSHMTENSQVCFSFGSK
jgi:hypothetical protein